MGCEVLLTISCDELLVEVVANWRMYSVCGKSLNVLCG